MNFNSLASASGAFVESCEVNLTNNWWGSNNPDFANIICGNVSVGSWLVLGLDCLVDWSSNCSSGADDVVEWCKNQIKLAGMQGEKISRKGKNWYVDIGCGIITVNAYSYTIITAHKK